MKNNVISYLENVNIDKVKRNRKSEVAEKILATVQNNITNNVPNTVKAISEATGCRIQYIHLLAKKSPIIGKYEHKGVTLILPVTEGMRKDNKGYIQL
jgi:hypothetical protein